MLFRTRSLNQDLTPKLKNETEKTPTTIAGTTETKPNQTTSLTWRREPADPLRRSDQTATMRRAIKNASSRDKTRSTLSSRRTIAGLSSNDLEPASVAYVAAPLTTAAAPRKWPRCGRSSCSWRCVTGSKSGQSFIVGVRGGRHVLQLLIFGRETNHIL